MNELGAHTKGGLWSVAPEAVLAHLTEHSDSLGRIFVHQHELAHKFGATNKAIHRILMRLRDLGYVTPLDPKAQRPRWLVVVAKANKARESSKPRKITWE